jgi:hypothetical protein
MRRDGTMAILLLVGWWSVAAVPTAAQMGEGYGGGGDGDRASAGLADQLTTARTHAMNAARSDILRIARWHLGHVINCLEGARGPNYDRSNTNPCQGQGNGILPDLEAAEHSNGEGTQAALALAREADRLALETMALADLAPIKAGAEKVANLLSTALSTVRY